MTIAQPARVSVATTRAPIDLLDITVLSGGPGLEREVSLQSGHAVGGALESLGHRVTIADISPEDTSALDRPADLFFIALHGEYGEDGGVQRELHRRGIAYTGSGPEASQLAMNKVEAKRRFRAAHIPTPPWTVLNADSDLSLLDALHLPAVVKPIASGSSVDITIARKPAELLAAARQLVDRYPEAMIERYITGREFTVGVIGDDVLPVCEIVTQRDFYDYHAKYAADDTQYLFDIDVPRETLAEAQSIARTAHHALGCEVMSRVDLMWEAATGKLFVLEVNTIPGFTSHSLVPKAAAHMGIGFEELCQMIVKLSLERHG